MRNFDARRVPHPQEPCPFPPFSGPIDLEIGCGAGYHPVRYAKAHPDRLLIAIERTQTRFAKLEGRLRHHPEVGNVLAVRADAIRWVTHRVPDGSLSRILLLYPNPYPKQRQLNKRWHHMPFMGHLLEKLVPEGTLTLATNIASYAREAAIAFATTWQCEVISERQFTSHDTAPREARSHFEKKYLERGETCTELVVRRG